MKVLVFSNSPEAYATFLVKTGKTCMGSTNDPQILVRLIVKFTPHLVLMDTEISSPELLDHLVPVFEATRFASIPSVALNKQLDYIRAAFGRVVLNPPVPEELPQSGDLVVAGEYKPFEEGNQLKFFRPSEEDPEKVGIQQVRLLWLLRTARKRRESIQAFWKSLRTLEPWENQEIGFRMGYQSFMATVFARDQIGRYLGFLAHTIPGSALEYLPLPGDAQLSHRFLRYEPAMESLYSFVLLSLFGINEHTSEAITKQMLWRFQGESDAEMMSINMASLGLMHYLRSVCAAQDKALDFLLDPQTPDRLQAPSTRMTLRALETFSDFWGFHSVVPFSHLLKVVLEELHQSPENIAIPEDLMPPTFAEFWQSLANEEERQEKSKFPQRK